MSISSPTNHMPYCAGYRDGGDLCVSKSRTIAGVRLELYGHETDVPPTAVRFDTGTSGAAYSVEAASRLSGALTAFGMLATADAEEPAACRPARLEVLETQDPRRRRHDRR